MSYHDFLAQDRAYHGRRPLDAAPDFDAMDRIAENVASTDWLSIRSDGTRVDSDAPNKVARAHQAARREIVEPFNAHVAAGLITPSEFVGLHSMIAAALDAAGPEWRDIGTAPKDRSIFALMDGKYGSVTRAKEKK